MSARRLVLAVLVVVAAGVLLLWPRSAPVVSVEPGQPVGSLADRHPGAVLELGPGRHEAFTVSTPVTVRGLPGSEVAGTVRVHADHVVLDGLRIVGGHDGVIVRGVDGVVIDRVHVAGAELHGIEVIDATVAITDCVVEGLGSLYAQGVEIRNATGRGRSLVEGCRVDGGMEGITTHSARVEVRANHVTSTTKRGIAIGEMSEGLVEGNRVEDVHGAGIVCVDMSHCEVVANTVGGVGAVQGGWNSVGGHGIAALYYSTVRTARNTTGGLDGEPLLLLTGSVEVDRFPLSHWPPGWRGAWLALPVAAVALAGLVGARAVAGALAGRRALRRPPRRRRPGRPVLSGPLRTVLVGAVVAGVAVQAFHMLEHLVQVWQVHVVHTENRSGILGARADVEWVHFLFNASVLAFLVLLWRVGRVTGSLDRRAGAWLHATLAVQTFHMAEHVAKLLQHLDDGLRVAPGIVGGRIGLVWFHYGINLAVFAGTVVAAALLISGMRRPARAAPPAHGPTAADSTTDVDEAPGRLPVRTGV